MTPHIVAFSGFKMDAITLMCVRAFRLIGWVPELVLIVYAKVTDDCSNERIQHLSAIIINNFRQS